MLKVQGFLMISGDDVVMINVNDVKYPEQLSCFGKIKDSEWDKHAECAICRWEWQCRYYHYDERY
jgi:hypothetical protein